MSKKIPIIDLFAGPGGLGEGFMSLKENDTSVFEIKLSIEKDEHAHKTLTWRSFYRQFTKEGKEVPEEYYKALKESNLKKREKLIESVLDSYPEGKEARQEARKIELGHPDWPAEKVDEQITERLEDEANWVLIGGPPCQAYSNVGRSRVGGIDKDDHRVYLYKEYLRIIEKHSPAVFIMENVRGLLSAKVEDEKVFDWMKRDLQVNGRYHIHSLVKEANDDADYLIKAEEYGIPQKRHRVILLGIREDLKHPGRYLETAESKISLQSVISKLPILRSGISKSFYKYHETEVYENGTQKRLYKNIDNTDENWLELISDQIEKLKRWGDIPLNGLSNGPTHIQNGIGAEYVACNNSIDSKHPLKSWYLDKRLKGVPNHESRSHLTQDLLRYMFAGLYVEKHGTFPRLEDYAKHHKDLIPDHANVESGKFTDRFRVQVADKPATTVTSHISKDGHYFIHYDAKQCRSLTVREAARVQTFPDNYLFRGSRTQQFHQVGNAVPPFLAYQISSIVKDIIDGGKS